MSTVYLDNAATTPLRREVRAEMEAVFAERWGNASSRHRRGVAARELLDRARERVARTVGARPEHVVFTSGGTEANNLALRGLTRRREARSIWIGPTEHASVRACAEALAGDGLELRRGQLDARGDLDLARLEGDLDEGTALVAQLLVSNEFGTIYDLPRAAALVRARAPHALLHVDAVQAAGKLALSLFELGADSLSLSAHKIGGPQGIGALVLARELPLEPLIHGGGQEGGLRSGTENLAGAVGLGKALELAESERARTFERLSELRRALRAGLERIEGLELLELGDPDRQQPGILAVLVPGAPAEVWLHHLDARGVVVGVGSACQANKRETSPAFAAAGLSEDRARRVLRLSLSGANTEEEVARAIAALEEVAAELATL